MPNLKPINVELTDPETGSAELNKTAGAGALNDRALETNETKCKEIANANFSPVPALDLETTAESETQA